MPLGIAITITFCQLLSTDAREVIVVQLKTTGSDDPGRKGNRAGGCDGARRSGRPDGSHSGGGISGGSRDRDVLLTPKLLDTLREYWRWMKPKTYLFPGTVEGWRADVPITEKQPAPVFVGAGQS